MKPSMDPTVQRWSTEDVPSAIKFDYWVSALSQALVPMHLLSRDRGGFRAMQEAIGLGPIDVIRSSGTAHETWRTRQDIERSEERSFHLLTSRSGSWCLRHRGEHRLQPGELILIDNGHEHWLGVEDSYDIVNLKIPLDWLLTWVPDPHALVGVPIREDAAWGRALSAFAAQLVPDALVSPRLNPTVMAGHVGTLLAIGADEIDTVSLAERRLRARIERLVRERCDEQDLSCADVARALNVPLRALNRSLLVGGRSFAAMLLEARALKHQQEAR